MTKTIFQIGNGIALVSTIILNYLSNTGIMNNTTIGEVSDAYTSLFTPAGYTFTIWGVIYMLLIGFVIYQGRSLIVKVTDDNFVLKTGWWFILSCLFNSLWVWAWIYEYTGLSCLLIFLLLLSLLKIVVNNRMELDDVSFPNLLFVTWPFVIYSGWVTVASIANIATYLKKINWNAFELSEIFWTVTLISVAVLINLLMMWKRKMRAFAFVGAWALVGIASANKVSNSTIVTAAYSGAAVLIVSSMIHMYRHRATNPFKKFKQSLK